MDDKLYIKKLEQIIADLLDGRCEWYEIQETTGLPEKRCQEISDMGRKILEKIYG